MKILMSGSTGFIGKHVVRRLVASGHQVQAIVRPSSDVDFLKKEKIPFYVFGGAKEAKDAENAETRLSAFIREEKFDGIIHLASLFLVQHKPENIAGLIDSNVFFGTALLEAVSSVGGEHMPWFINTGTFWQHYEDETYSPVNLYAATKQAFEDIARYYIETFGIDFVTIELSDTFGPGDTRQKILNLWQKIAASGEKMEMSAGEQMIDISYIDNVVDGYEQMALLLTEEVQKKKDTKSRGKYAGKSFAVSSGEPMKLRDLAALFEKVSGKKLNIGWGAKEYRPREVMKTWSKGKKIPGWEPRVSVEQGMEKYIHHKGEQNKHEHNK